MLVSRPRGYISPSQWQTGVPAAFVSYDVNHWRYRTPDMEIIRVILVFVPALTQEAGHFVTGGQKAGVTVMQKVTGVLKRTFSTT